MSETERLCRNILKSLDELKRDVKILLRRVPKTEEEKKREEEVERRRRERQQDF